MYARMQRGLMAKAANPRYDTAMDLKLETTVTSIDVVGALFPAWMKRYGELPVFSGPHFVKKFARCLHAVDAPRC